MKLAVSIGIAFLGQISSVDQEAILRRAREFVVGEFDPTLPSVSVDRWLGSLAAPGADVGWTLNDCGEQTGSPAVDQAREVPMCAEGHVALGDGRELSVLLHVGTWRRGVSDGAPRFRSAYLKEADETLRSLPTLVDVVSAVRDP